MFPDMSKPFDEFLASLELLEACERHAIGEIIAEQKVGAGSQDGTK
jgi:hypothetical protein